MILVAMQRVQKEKYRLVLWKHAIGATFSGPVNPIVGWIKGWVLVWNMHHEMFEI